MHLILYKYKKSKPLNFICIIFREKLKKLNNQI